MKNSETASRKRLSPAQIIVIGFFGVVLIGAGLLCLPFSTVSGKWCSFTDALFTSVSATCVTGLVVVDTATQWSFFGQLVILLLIQTGGLGVVTLYISFCMLLGRKIGLADRNLMRESVSAPEISGIVRFAKYVFLCTFISEAAGALIMLPVFAKDFGFFKGLWVSAFQSVSAFCNAGFDLFGANAPFSSLTAYAANPVVNVVTMLLIIAGGLGFFTWKDVMKNGVHFKRYRLQSKMIVVTTAVLIFLPAIWLFFAEFSDRPLGERILCSLFQAVTPRTAGFNTVDLNSLSDKSRAITVVLMLIGGSPGSTAGGMKTTVFALTVLTTLAVFFKKQNTEAFGRRIELSVVRQALSVFFVYVFLFFAGGLVISAAENLPISVCLFESASALGTVGLTLGITPALGLLSQTVLMLLMFFGRVGVLTVFYATVSPKKVHAVLPEEKMQI